MTRASTATDHRERVLRTIVEIERDLDHAQSLDELAAHACLSPFHFHRVFAWLVGEGPAEYTRRLRLERAAHHLATSRDPVAGIGRRAGYVNPESFTRAFQARFGVSPSKFRAEQAPKWSGRGDAGVPSDGRVETVPGLTVAFIRHVGAYEQVVPQFERLRGWASAQAGRAPGGREPLMLGIAHDIPGVTPTERLRFDCCIEVESSCRPEGEVGVRRVLGGMHAVAVHQGTFATLGDTYARLAMQVVPSFRAIPTGGPSVEIYLTPPERTMSEPGLTEILMPVRVG